MSTTAITATVTPAMTPASVAIEHIYFVVGNHVGHYTGYTRDKHFALVAHDN